MANVIQVADARLDLHQWSKFRPIVLEQLAIAPGEGPGSVASWTSWRLWPDR